MPATNAAAMVPRNTAKRNGSVFRNFLRIDRPPTRDPHCNRFGNL